VLARGDDHVLSVGYIGKETNLIEQQAEGVAIIDPQAVYDDPEDGDGWAGIQRWLCVEVLQSARQAGPRRTTRDRRGPRRRRGVKPEAPG
jgi:hypothetical protein